ncbi:MAG: hypothetical protein JSW62_00600 [Thermoplasmatales archaeon]|nr:MAG: hypothetical protein JSW62_00600 [Thermoplasmatales archaeon]
MKLVKTASGKETIKISKSDWESIGRRAGWMKTAYREHGEVEEIMKVKSALNWFYHKIKKPLESLMLELNDAESLYGDESSEEEIKDIQSVKEKLKEQFALEIHHYIKKLIITEILTEEEAQKTIDVLMSKLHLRDALVIELKDYIENAYKKAKGDIE